MFDRLHRDPAARAELGGVLDKPTDICTQGVGEVIVETRAGFARFGSTPELFPGAISHAMLPLGPIAGNLLRTQAA